MYKIYINDETFGLLTEWSKQYERFVINCPPYTRKFNVICSGLIEEEANLYLQSTLYGYKFTFRTKDWIYGKGKIVKDDDANIQISVDVNRALDESLIETLLKVVKVYCDAFLMANAFLMYGNMVEDKEFIASGRNSGIDKVIVFRKYKDKLYAVPVDHRRSPEGVFEVRGHFRHYRKTGKLIWIDSYLKGVEKNTDEVID